MAVALAQQRARLKAEAPQAEPAAVAVQMRTVLMRAENASRGPFVIRPGVWHARHCTAVTDACAMAEAAGMADAARMRPDEEDDDPGSEEPAS